jgi:CRP-like cAMP-binding protein
MSPAGCLPLRQKRPSRGEGRFAGDTTRSLPYNMNPAAGAMARGTRARASRSVEMNPQLPHKAHFIRKLESVTQLSNEERQSIVDLPVLPRLVGAHEEVVQDGGTPTACVLILQGFACRYKHTASGARQIFSFHIAGDIPDLQGLFLETMDHSLGTLTPSLLAFISHDAIRRLIRRHPRLGEALWRETLIDAAIFRQWIMALGRRSAAGRAAHFLCEHWVRSKTVGLTDGNSCELPLTQTDIADALGLSTVHVNRSLQTLRREGLVELRKSHMIVLDWDGLVKRAEFSPAYLQQRPPRERGTASAS